MMVKDLKKLSADIGKYMEYTSSDETWTDIYTSTKFMREYMSPGMLSEYRKEEEHQAYYYFYSIQSGSDIKIRPLANQIGPDGELINPSLNVQCDKAIRSMYPIGTIFYSSTCERKSKFYQAGHILPLLMRLDDKYADPSHKPDDETWCKLMAEYRSLILDTSEAEEHEKHDEEASAAPTFISELKSDAKNIAPNINDDGFYVSDPNWYLLLRNIMRHKNTMLIGPTGTGKTELIMLACKRLGIECNVFDMGSMYDPIAGLLGVHRLMKGGVSTFDYAKFTQAVQKPGVVLLDELSRAPVTSLNILFPCLDSRRSLPVEIAGGEDVRSIAVHPECTFIATANIGSEYTGTMSMDRALVGRFFPIELDYLPKSIETDLLKHRCGINQTAAKNIVDVAASIRSIYKKEEISCSISTRETLMAAELVADGWTAVDALELVFLPLFEGTNDENERSVVRKIIMAH